MNADDYEAPSPYHGGERSSRSDAIPYGTYLPTTFSTHHNKTQLNGNLQGVPFVVLAGKRMSERVAFARVRFKQQQPPGAVCLTEGCGLRYVEYHVQVW